MKYLTGAALVILTAGIFLTSCSQGISPVEPSATEPSHQLSKVSNSHNLWGLYTFICDPGRGTVEVIPLREADMHLNALKFLEPPALVYLKIEGQPQFSGNVLDVDIGLTNPYLGWDQFTGFDVCGVVFTHGSVSGFSDPDIVMAGEGDTHLLNPDGYTRWWNPVEFPHGDTVNCYIDGMIGTPADMADLNCTINGYKYFADGLDKDDPLTELDISKRGMFSSGKKNVRHYKIDMIGGFIFNYAVDACWKKPSIMPPQNIPDDFPPEANRVEAWNVTVTELLNNLHYVDNTCIIGGELVIRIDVWDHFNAGINGVYAESLAGLPLTVALTPIGGGAGYSTYELDLDGDQLSRNGSAELLIAVCSEVTGYNGILPGIPVASYFIHSFDISPEPPAGWAITWGEVYQESVDDIVVDNSGNVYVTGKLPHYDDFPIDLDPGPGLDLRYTTGHGNCFLIKYTSHGAYQWGRIWGEGECIAGGYGLATDELGNVYITGCYWGNLDLDPGPGVDMHPGEIGDEEVYVSKFDPDGNFKWACSWGNDYCDVGYAVGVDSFGNVHVTGRFGGTVDFDPGPGVDEHTSFEDKPNCFLSKISANGDFLWARTWGGNTPFMKKTLSRDVVCDAHDNVYVTGNFYSSFDFDPGPGEDWHSTNGKSDIFLSRFDKDGNYIEAATWGGIEEDYGWSIALYDEAVYVAGAFRDTVDFDPGPGIEEHSDDEGSSYLSKFTTGGVFQWVNIIEPYRCRSIAVDGAGNIYAVCETDAFIGKFNSSGGLMWSYDWDISTTEYGSIEAAHISVRSNGDAYIAGMYYGSDLVDFDPGPGTDLHTCNDSYDAFLCKFPPDGNW